MADFSTKQYGWKDITVVIGGKVIEGITNVEYSKKRTKSYLPGRGAKPHGIQSGLFEYEGTLELWMSVTDDLEDAAPNGEITDLVCDVVIMYASDEVGAPKTRILKGTEFTELTEGMGQGDTHKLITTPIMFLDIERD